MTERKISKRFFMAGVLLLLAAGTLTLFPNKERLDPPHPPREDTAADTADSLRPRQQTPLAASNTPAETKASHLRASEPGEQQDDDAQTHSEAEREVMATDAIQALSQGDAEAVDYARIARLSYADILEAAGDLSDPETLDQTLRKMQELEDLRREAGRKRAEELGLPLRVELPDGHVREVVGIDEDGRPLYYETHNVNAAISTAADQLQAAPYHLNGADLVIGMWDGGSGRTTHDEFAGGRMVNMDGSGFSHHATHVGGTMIAAGVLASAKGMATAAQVDSYDWNSDFSEMTSRGAAAPDEEGKIFLSNHSYGYIRGWDYVPTSPTEGYFEWWGTGTGTNAVDGGFGRYNIYSRDADALVFSKPYYSIFWSAGNDRADSPSTGGDVALSPGGALVSYDPDQHPPGDGVYRGGYDIIGDHAVSKNVITIGAVNDAVSGGVRNLGSAGMAWFSAWGPTDDGRIKPDLVANGTGLESSSNDHDSHYETYSGTSMSSPNAAGTAALLIQEYQQHFPGESLRASALKGLLIHTADDLGTAGPDYRYGWGLINGLAAAELLTDHASASNSLRLIENGLSSANRPVTLETVWDGVSPIRVTLTWTDPAGLSTTATDNRTARLVNNLDVKVIGPDDTEYLPYVMPFVGTWTQASMSAPATTGTNNTDNVEQVHIPAPANPGSYQIVVDYQGTLDNSPQQYTLLVSGLDTANDPAEDLTLDGNLDFGEALIDTETERVVTLYNTGLEAITVTNFTFPDGFSGTWTGTLQPGASRDVVVRFSPLSVTDYDGQLLLQLDDSESDVLAPMTAAGIRYLTITDPADDPVVPFSVETHDVAGVANAALAGQLTWTNTATGGTGALPVAASWQVDNVPLAEGTNLFTAFGTNNPVATNIAADSAAATWSEGDNAGSGFNAWIWSTTGTNAGHFVATTNENPNVDIDSPAWGLWANSGEQANAYRPLAQPLQAGVTFHVTMENNSIENGNSVGVALLNTDGDYLFEFYFVGGESNYRINDSAAGYVTALPHTDTGIELTLTRIDEDTYDLTANAVTLLSRSFADRTNMEITRFRVFNDSAGAGGAYDVFFNNLSAERAAGEPVTVSDQVEITRLGPPPDTPELFVGQVEDTYFDAYWTAPASATGYVFDVHTDESFTNSVTSAGGAESFSDTGPISSTFRTLVWTNSEIVWTAYKARNSDTLTGPALGLQDDSGAYFVSEPIPEGVDQISIDYERPAAGGPTPEGTFSIYVNDTLKGGPYTLQSGTQSAIISGIGENGPATIMITNSGARTAIFDNLSWTNDSVVLGAFVPGYSNLMTAATNMLVEGLEPGTEYYLRVKAMNDNGESGYAATNTTTLGQAREPQTISFDPIEGDIVTTQIVTLSATASSGLPVSFHVESGPATITNENEAVFSASGEITIVATQDGDEAYQPAPPVNRSFFVNKAVPTILTAPEASDLTAGQSLAISSLTGGTADTDGVFVWLDDTILPPGGLSTQTVAFLPDDTNFYANAETDIEVTVLFVSLQIDPVSEQEIVLNPLAETNLIYTLTNSGNTNLEWSIELLSHDFFDDMEQGTNGWTIAGDNALWNLSTNRSVSGTSSWHSGYTELMFARSVTPPIRLHTNAPSLVFDHWIEAEIEPDTQTAYHGGLVAISTDGTDFILLEPDGGYPYALSGSSLEVYSGFSDWTAAAFDLTEYAGEHVWLAFYFITDSFYSGTEEGWYIDNVAVSPRDAGDDWIQLSPLSGTVAPEDSATVTAELTAPAYLAGATRQAVFSVESINGTNPVQSRVIELQVNKQEADIFLGDVVQLYDGSPKSASATTDPAGLNVVFTYDGAPALPVEVGDYSVDATIEEPAWVGATTGTLSIVELRGAIDAEDSIPPADDLDMPFGNVIVGQERIEQVTIHNTNLVDALTVSEAVIGGETMEETAAATTAVHAHTTPPSPRTLRQTALRSDAPRSPDTLLVRFKPQAETRAARDAVHTVMGAERRHQYRYIPVELVELPPGADLAETIASYEARPDVDYAEPNFIYSTMNTPDDPSFGSLWGLHNTGQSGGTPGADISALQAWDTTTGSSNVIVAIIDTGIDYNHGDLADNMWVNPDPTFGDVHGARFIDGTGEPTSGDPMDDHSHGTHVAGTVGAVGNNGVGVVGVAWNVRLMALKFITSANQGTLADAIASIEYAIEHGAHLSNNSWGGGGYSQALKDAIEAAGAVNQLFVAAAGNSNNNNDTNPAYPASYDSPNIISVANSTHTDARRSSSNYGVNTVHLAAPGTSIYSTEPNGQYGTKTGTSMAAPHVAGTAALLLSLHPNTAYANVKNWILSSVTPLSNWETLVSSGGRLNAADALATSLENGFSIADQPPMPVVIPPGESITLDIRFRPPSYDTFTNTLHILNNDLDQPEIIVSLSGTGISTPPAVTITSAAQTATNATGRVTIETEITDPDSAAIDLEVLFSVDDGSTWSNAWIASAGAAAVTNGATPQVSGIDTSAGSNELVVVWSTTNQPPILISTSTLVRARAWDGIVWGVPSTSTPFLVDNEAPAPPTGLLSSSHTASVWSVVNALDTAWDASDDGAGIGVAGYGASVEIGMGAPPSSVTATGLTYNATDLADGTNWWFGVRAVDGYGNAGAATHLGPFWIDATAPAATGAVIEIQSSEYGDYSLGGILTNTWNGFSDNLSGLSGYYLALNDGGGTTNGLWTTNTAGHVPDAVLNQTNVVYVWARDIAGNVGNAASASMLILDPDGDRDGDGISNKDEEITGMSSIDSESVFAGEAVVIPADPDAVSVRWPHTTGRVYTLYWSNDALSDSGFEWTVVSSPVYTISDGVATWTDPNPLNGPDGRRVYRIEVRLE